MIDLQSKSYCYLAARVVERYWPHSCFCEHRVAVIAVDKKSQAKALNALCPSSTQRRLLPTTAL